MVDPSEKGSPNVGPTLAVVIPVHNESGAILPLLGEVDAALRGHLDYELLVVNDASTDATGAELAGATQDLEPLTVLTHRRQSGQSAALLTGIRSARAPWIATLDGDGQNDPKDILPLWRSLGEGERPRMLCGVRQKRQDSATKRLASRIANGVRSWILKDGVEDTGCGLKLFERSLFLELPHFDHMHRFLPALALAAGASVATHPVSHRPRSAGRSKYGIFDRLREGIVDLAGVWWLNRRSLRPEIRPPQDPS